jgi:hypothetical protein
VGRDLVGGLKEKVKEKVLDEYQALTFRGDKKQYL